MNEADLMDAILDALERAGLIVPGAGGEGYSIETITGMSIDLMTESGQAFTLSIDTL